MRLKKLELSGFKSFAQKTTLEFPAEICAIVGPNGSGKSNVVDALRWVLGEQSFKQLRSKTGSDLIWAGSAKKPAVGKAHVNLYFDNSDNFFPLDFSEIIIGRKVYKDGQNEYYLNESQVRLKDVAELLARSKLGLRGHTIINQGSADSVLRASPEDRRIILEEALGLKEFQLKKAEAETKLTETQVNLEKAGALAGEIAPHLRLLKRQADKLARRRDLETALDDSEDSYFKVILRDLILAKTKILKSKESLAGDLEEKRATFEGREQALEERAAASGGDRDATSRIERDLSELSSQRQEATRQLGRLEGLIEAAKTANPQKSRTLETVLASKIQFWAKRLDAALKYANFNQAKDIVANTAKEIREVASGLEKKDFNIILAQAQSGIGGHVADSHYAAEQNRFKSILAKIEKDENILRSKLAQLKTVDQDWRSEYLEAQKNLEFERRALLALEGSLRDLVLEEEKIKLREEDIRAKMWSAGKNLDEFVKKYFASPIPGIEVLTIQETQIAGAIDLLELESKITKLRRELIEIGGIDEATAKEYEETQQRHDFLATEITDLEKAIGSLKGLISNLDEKIGHDFKIGLAKINEEFNKYFRMLFDGGSARLSEVILEDVNESGLDPFRSRARAYAPEGPAGRATSNGVDIHVNIPQKRIRDLNLLSGGERSLVSVGILFAIVAASRPPFLILDEIDAALDESNALRFARMLKDLARSTQFILITHNRATMEAAEVLYGVTMGDDGVSKLLSLRLEEAFS